MAKVIACQCGARFALKPEWAGKKIKCPKCGHVMQIPAVSEPAVPGQPPASSGKAVRPRGRRRLAPETGKAPRQRRMRGPLPDKEASLQRAGSIAAIPLGALVLLFFVFVPWTSMKLTFLGTSFDIFNASGLQLALGTGSVAEKTKSSPQSFTLAAKANDEKVDEMIGARPWFFLIPISALLIILVGILSLIRKIDAVGAGKALLVLGILGSGTAGTIFLVDYSDDFIAHLEKNMNMKNENAETKKMFQEQKSQIEKSIDTGVSIFSILNFALLLLIPVAGGANLLLSRKGGSPGANRPGPEA